MKTVSARSEAQCPDYRDAGQTWSQITGHVDCSRATVAKLAKAAPLHDLRRTSRNQRERAHAETREIARSLGGAVSTHKTLVHFWKAMCGRATPDPQRWFSAGTKTRPSPGILDASAQVAQDPPGGWGNTRAAVYINSFFPPPLAPVESKGGVSTRNTPKHRGLWMVHRTVQKRPCQGTPKFAERL